MVYKQHVSESGTIYFLDLSGRVSHSFEYRLMPTYIYHTTFTASAIHKQIIIKISIQVFTNPGFKGKIIYSYLFFDMI